MNPDAEKWIELATYDLDTAEAMLASGRYLYVLFCSQQAIEKRLKAEIVEKTGTFPPRTHDLTKLAQLSKIQIPEEWDLYLRILTKYYIGTRYPEEITSMTGEVTRDPASRSFSKTKEFFEWVETLRK